jgi:hypothetical protein
MWIISKGHREFFFLYIFAIHSSSRHEKRCQMSVRLFSLFQGSRNQQCEAMLDRASILKRFSLQYFCSFFMTKCNDCFKVTGPNQIKSRSTVPAGRSTILLPHCKPRGSRVVISELPFMTTHTFQGFSKPDYSLGYFSLFRLHSSVRSLYRLP